MKKHLKSIIAILLAAVMLFSACDLEDDIDVDDPDTPVTQTVDNDTKNSENKDNDTSGTKDNTDVTAGPDGTDTQTKSLSLTVNSDSGELKVNRRVLGLKGNSDLPAGWTILVYLCGTDLESEYSAATYDLDEMLAASESDKVKFIVETGGTNSWNNEVISSNKLQRYLIQNGDIKLLDEKSSDNMGKLEVLSDFLNWGLKNYASAHNGLIMWNHGGGSITGVCFDEKYDYDSIDLTELNSALNESVSIFGRKLDFVGFDACLMGSVETANILATFAEYMYGSEEVEPGSGWNYTAIGDYLATKPDANGLELGKVVADSFLKACKDDDDDFQVTFSIIDLSKIDNILTSFNSFAKDIYEAAEDTSKRAEIVRAIGSVDDFGGNNRTEGYANMIDLGGMINACASYSKSANAAFKAVSDAVVYSVSGDMHEGVSGLSTYYPISVQGSNELSFFGKVCISPYYLSFVDLLGSVGASGDMYTEYDDDTWFDDDGDWFWGDDWDYYDDAYWDYIDDYEVTGYSPYITFSVEPTFEDGMYYFALDEEGYYNTSDVYGLVYVLSEDGTEAIEYGQTYDIDADWDYGIFFDNFDGWWISLPDGQNLATYIVDYTEDSEFYTSPVLLNGRETNLRLKLTADKIVIEGAWDGIDDECGAASRDVVKLKKGDRITPIYYSLSLYDDYDYDYYGDYYDEDDGLWYGDEYVFDGDPEIYYDLMYPGEYMYAFCIEDIYGDYYMTDFETFYIDENGDVEF